jgi:hypothetical protein
MKFAQRSAGKAYTSRCPNLGTVHPSMTPHTRLPRIFALLATLVAAAAFLPASALAGSPLLSGYAAPGSGEQAVLGGGVVGGGSGGSGSNDDNNSGASGSLAVSATTNHASGSAPTTDSTGASGRSSSGSGSTLRSSPHRKNSAGSSSSHTKATTGSTSSSSSQASSATTPTTARPGAPAVVPYRNTSGAVSSSPVTFGGVLIALFGLLAVVLAALGTRMVLRDGNDDGPPISQVAVR